MNPFLTIFLSSFALWGLKKLLKRFSTSPNAPYPPGPKPKLLIGNALDFPLVNAAETYTEWGRRYNSGILHLEALGNHIIILNNFEAAEELLEKRASNYSDRPVLPVFDLMGSEFNVAIMGYNDEWRFHRRICQQNFRQAESHKYIPIQTKKVREMLQSLLDSPREFDNHNKILSIAIPLASMYGYEAKSLDDPCIKAADEAATLGASLLLPGNLVNIFPILARIPSWVPGIWLPDCTFNVFDI